MSTTEDYRSKENYITRDSRPDRWVSHANFGIMTDYSEHIRGSCADLGCNHGACTLLLSRFSPDSIHGFDLNPAALKIAQANANTCTTIPCRFVEANLCDMKSIVPDSSFDYVQSFHTLEHIYVSDAGSFAAEAFRIMKRGAHFVISIPYDREYPDPCHVAFYKEDALKRLFESVGFTTIECFKDDTRTERGLLTALFEKR